VQTRNGNGSLRKKGKGSFPEMVQTTVARMGRCQGGRGRQRERRSSE